MCERSLMLMPAPAPRLPTPYLPRLQEWALSRTKADGTVEYWTGHWQGEKPVCTPSPLFALRWRRPVDGPEIGGALTDFEPILVEV